MIADLLRRSLAWARGFFWVADSDSNDGPGRATKPAGPSSSQTQAKSQGKAASTAKRDGQSAGGTTAGAQRRSAADKTSTNKRGSASRTVAKSAAAKGGAATSGSAKAGAAKGGAEGSGAAKAGGSQAGGSQAGATSNRPGAAATGNAASTSANRASSGAAQSGGAGDLTEIKGIGPAMQTKLGALGIHSFADLAGANADQLARQLASRPITAERVRVWIAEAKKRG